MEFTFNTSRHISNKEKKVQFDQIKSLLKNHTHSTLLKNGMIFSDFGSRVHALIPSSAKSRDPKKLLSYIGYEIKKKGGSYMISYQSYSILEINTEDEGSRYHIMFSDDISYDNWIDLFDLNYMRKKDLKQKVLAL